MLVVQISTINHEKYIMKLPYFKFTRCANIKEKHFLPIG